MPVATATVTVDDEGVVKGLRTMQNEFAETGDAVDEMGESVERAEGAVSDSASRFEQFSSEVQQTATVTKGFTNAQMQLVQGGKDVVQSLDRQADAVEQISRETKSMASQTSKYNQIVFSTGDLVQDLQFGIKGAANNIAFMAEQMAESSGQAGGFSRMLKGVFSALKGPAGIILGIQTLLALGPQLASWFSSRTEEAEEMKSAVEDAAEGMLEIQSTIAGVEVENLEEAQELRGNLEERVRLNEKLVTFKDEMEAGVEPEQMGELLNVMQQRTQEQLSRTELQERASQLTVEELENIEASLPVQRAALEEAKNTVQTFKARQELQESFTEAGAESKDAQEEVTGEVETTGTVLEEVHQIQNKVLETTEEISFDERLDIDATNLFSTLGEVRTALDEGMIGTIDNVNELISKYETKFKHANEEGRESIGPVLERLRELRDEMKGTGDEGADVFEKPIGSVQDLQQRLGTGTFDSIRKVETALSFLDTQLQQATSDQQRERIRGVIQRFKDLRAEMKGASSDVSGLDDAFTKLESQQILARALTDNFQQFAKAVGQGERVMEAFGKAALGVLASVGKAMGKQLIAKGSALLASALIPGLQGNAAAGAKLIAAGTTLLAASSALSGAIGGGSGGGAGGGEGQNVQGGGTSRTSVEAPGRRRGGPVRGGQLYETHGLGRREFFMPERDGQIVTDGQMEGATGGGRTVDVRTQVDSQVGVEDAEFEFDLGRLRLRLNELETKVDKVT